MSERVYCDYDTGFFFDHEYILAFCEESDIESGCGWMVRAVNDAPVQSNRTTYGLFKQIQELNALHKTSWRTQEQVDKTHAFAEEARRIFSDD